MNERIEGLWWKARIGYNNQNCDPEVLEKFAELIIEECCVALHPMLRDMISRGQGVELIKKHFGVE